MLAKTMYVATMRALRSQAGAVGLRQPVAGERGARAHLRSLLDVHDADALIRWDMPWWTYKAVDEVDAYLAQRPSARVLEYGSVPAPSGWPDDRPRSTPSSTTRNGLISSRHGCCPSTT